MHRLLSKALAAFAACVLSVSATATIIEYDITNVAGATWRYDYFVTNDSLGSPLEEFTVFFELGLYEDLALGGAPDDWDPLIAQPDPNLPDDGFYDALALGSGIAPGATLGGFFVTFTWLGAGTPGDQSFDVVDPSTFAPLDSGFTRLRIQTPPPPPPTGVTEPGELPLFVTVLLLLGVFARRMSNKKANAHV